MKSAKERLAWEQGPQETRQETRLWTPNGITGLASANPVITSIYL